MNIVLSSTVLASVLTPAFSFSYLDSLGGNSIAAAPPAAAAPAFNAPVPAAPAPAAPYQSGFADIGEVATTSAGYLDSVNTGNAIDGPGVMTHVDTLNSGSSLLGGPGIHTYAENIPVSNSFLGGSGFQTYTDALSPSSGTGSSYSPYGSSVSAASSGDGVSFTLETGDISGLVQDLSPGGTLRLTGSIDSVSYN